MVHFGVYMHACRLNTHTQFFFQIKEQKVTAFLCIDFFPYYDANKVTLNGCVLRLIEQPQTYFRCSLVLLAV